MKKRYPQLDALRGVAALFVALRHATETAGYPDLLDARAAVMLFFVLSGFVLALPWVYGKPPPLLFFILRRAIRLWFPCAAAILLSAVLFVLIKHDPPQFVSWWRQSLTTGLIGRCLLLTGQYGGCSLDGPLWSLVYEFRISLFFPLLVYLTLRAPGAMAILAAILGLSIELKYWSLTGRRIEFLDVDGLRLGVLTTIHYAGFFIMGILMAMKKNLQMSGVTSAMVAIFGGACLLVPSDTANAVGSCLIIALAIGSPIISRILMFAPLQWLGLISFSLYVVHVPVLLAISYGVTNAIGPAVVLLHLAAYGCAAALMFFLVERPSIRLGHRMAAYHAPKNMPDGTPGPSHPA